MKLRSVKLRNTVEQFQHIGSQILNEVAKRKASQCGFIVSKPVVFQGSSMKLRSVKLRNGAGHQHTP